MRNQRNAVFDIDDSKCGNFFASVLRLTEVTVSDTEPRKAPANGPTVSCMNPIAHTAGQQVRHHKEEPDIEFQEIGSDQPLSLFTSLARQFDTETLSER